MNKTVYYIAVGLIAINAVVAITPFIGYAIDGAPNRLWPAVAGIISLLFSIALWRKAFKTTTRLPLHFSMTLNFLSLVLISISWLGVPFIDSVFLVIGNIALVLFFLSGIMSFVLFIKNKKV